MATNADFEKRLKEVEEANQKVREENETLKKKLSETPNYRSGEWAGSDDEETRLLLKDLVHQQKNRRKYSRAKLPSHDKNVFKSFGHMIREGFENPGGFEEKLTKAWQPITKAVQGMSTSVGSDGGFLIPPEFSNQLFEKVYSNELMSRLSQFTVAGNNMTFPRSAETSRANGSRSGGIRGYWTSEGATITKSNPKVSELTLKLHKLAIVVYLTQELIDDAGPSAEQYVVSQADREFNFMLGDAVFNGNGNGQPLGLLNSAAILSISKETGQSATTIVAENIDKMWARRYAASNGYAWYKNQDTDPQLSQLSQAVGTGGSLLYRPPGGMADTPYASLKGAPCIDTEFNATLGTVGDIVLADLAQVVAITKGSIEQAESMHVQFLTDQMALRFTFRCDWAPWETTPVTPYKGSNTQASFLSLATRS